MRARAVALAIAACVGSVRVGAAAELPAFTYLATNCENAYYFVATSAARARAAGVPARFAVLGEPLGLAVVGVLVVTCDVSLNGGPAERTSWSEVGVLIAPPQGLNPSSIVIDIYRLWHVTDREEWLQLNRAWGIPTRRADVDTTYVPGLLFPTARGFVDDPKGRYGHEGLFEPIVHPGAPGVVAWWTLGKQGLVRFDQEFTNDTEQCGVGTLYAEGRMARLVGERAFGFHGCEVFADLIGSATQMEP